MNIKKLKEIFETEGYYGLIEYVSRENINEIAEYDEVLALAIYSLNSAKIVIEERLSYDI